MADDAADLAGTAPDPDGEAIFVAGYLNRCSLWLIRLDRVREDRT